MACLETTILIDILRGKTDARGFFEELQRTEPVLTVAAPSVMELWHGALVSRRSEFERSEINQLISSLIVLTLDEKSAKEAGEIEAGLLKAGLIVETEDIMIAGIARANGEKLVTRDEHYARIPGLRVLKY